MKESIHNKSAQLSAAKFFHANNGRFKWPETINGVAVEIVLIKEFQRGQRIIGILSAPDPKYPGDMYAVCKQVVPICDDPSLEFYLESVGEIADKLRGMAALVITEQKEMNNED